MKRKKPYTIRHILSKLKGQKLWVKMCKGHTRAPETASGWRVSYEFQYTPSIATPINEFQVRLKIEEGTSKVEFVIRHAHPVCLHHRYFFDIQCQEDFDRLLIIALQMRKLSHFNFGGTPDQYTSNPPK